MTKRQFQCIAVVTLPLAAMLAFVVGRFIARPLASMSNDLSGLLTLLGHALSGLFAVIVWAAALWPLRRRAGFTSLSDDLGRMRDGGLIRSVQRERQALEERSTSNDPKTRADYYKSMTLAGFVVTGVGALLSVALLSDGILMALPLILAFVGFPLSIYYGVQYLRWSSRDRE